MKLSESKRKFDTSTSILILRAVIYIYIYIIYIVLFNLRTVQHLSTYTQISMLI